MSISKTEFGFSGGYKCYLFTLKNKNGVTVKLTNFGASVVSLCVPDKNGKFDDVVLGYDTLSDYENGCSSQGAVVGRYANRIKNASIKINGTEYKLSKNDNGNTLHGGFHGFNKRVWTVAGLHDSDEPSLIFGYLSPDGEENFPGNLKVAVKYTLTKDNALVIDYSAVSDADTVINLTNHSYFNLNGEGSGDIKNHIVKLYSEKYTPVDSELIPLGHIAYVTGTPFDFIKPKRIGEDMESGVLKGGYDHNFILGAPGIMRTAAVVTSPESGRIMTVKTDMPAIQFYTSGGLDGEKGKGGKIYNAFDGFCLESQFSPNTPNQPQFPSCVFKAGQQYHFTTSYEFTV